MSKGKLEKNEQSKLKFLSSIIALLASLGRIAIFIAIGGVVLCMLFVFPFFNHLKVDENKVTFNYNNESVVLEKESNTKAVVYTNNKEEVEKVDIKSYDTIKEFLDKYSTKQLACYTMSVLLFVVIYLILINMVLKHLKKLFKNIKNGDTPFTLDNVEHMKKMGVFMIVAILFPLCTSLLFKLMYGFKLSINFGIIDIVEILFVFAMSFVFRYGYNLQQDSKKTIYDED